MLNHFIFIVCSIILLVVLLSFNQDLDGVIFIDGRGARGVTLSAGETTRKRRKKCSKEEIKKQRCDGNGAGKR